MKIVVDRRIPGLVEGILLDFPDYKVVALEGADIGRDDVRDAEALFVRTRTRCDAALLEGSAVKTIGTATIGTDHIALDWCRANGIRVFSAPGCNAPAVMQYVASSLSLAGFDPHRDVLGVVGKGNIGSLVADLYRRAGGKVLVCDPPRSERGLKDEDYLPLERLLGLCDAVTFHVPYTASGPHPTHHLLKGSLPERLRVIVNASRGGVVDPAVVDSSRKFIIDTWPFEDFPKEFDKAERDKLIKLAFIATPHIAGYSFEGKARATAAMLKALGAREAVGEATAPNPYPATLEEVATSFSPLGLSEALKAEPESFETLRGNHMRHEP